MSINGLNTAIFQAPGIHSLGGVNQRQQPSQTNAFAGVTYPSANNQSKFASYTAVPGGVPGDLSKPGLPHTATVGWNA